MFAFSDLERATLWQVFQNTHWKLLLHFDPSDVKSRWCWMARKSL